ncbi:helix-turn-helix domain-containing protein [Sinimarinibacterium thermocellulolyticum]|uniref:Helix-turn-helix transcriptional regulator n=1 Tax=Sinimarinibacterium thermocellulolyticum TaxID=3170016 RepID=A0ABV2A7J4_9GAMM
MADIAGLLKSEITRLSNKVARQHFAPLRATVTAQRREITALKRQITALEQQISRLQRRESQAAPAAAPAEQGPRHRFVAKGFRSLRERLGLTADEMGALVGVSGQSVYNWEHQKAKPRARQLAAIAELRGLGKKEARARLEALSAANPQAPAES